jgi:predicted transcriptional regulator
MNTSLFSLKTSQAVLDSVQRAASRKMSPHEALEQRVSFVYGTMDAKSNVTREQVRQLIIEQQGGMADKAPA